MRVSSIVGGGSPRVSAPCLLASIEDTLDTLAREGRAVLHDT